MRFLIILFIVCFLLIANISAQKTATKFSSVYTDLDKNCKTIGGENGSDPAYDCRGVGVYRIYIWYSAAAQYFAIKTAKKTEMTNIATQSLDFNESKVKVEWRMANGKPFAMIMRVETYAEPDDSHPYFGKKIGEELIIKGLKGFEKIDFTVDAKTPNANAEARKLADNAYLNK